MGVTYRAAGPGDEERLTRFNEEACNAHVPPAFWRWKYFENPAGPYAMTVALEGDRIVGRVGTYPLRVRVGDREVTARQAADIDVLDAYRAGGTFFRLERKTTLSPRGVRFPFSFAVAIDATRKISTTRLKFALVAPIRKLVKVLDPFAYAAARTRFRVLSAAGRPVRRRIVRKSAGGAHGFREVEVQRFDERFDALWNGIEKAPIMLVKDAAYLNWRYVQCPGVRYRIHALEKDGMPAAFVAYHLRERGGITYGLVGDMLCLPGDPALADALVSLAIRRIASENAHAVMCWLPEHGPLSGLLRKKGFRVRPTPHYWIVRPETDEFPEAFLVEEKNWSYSLGDSDYWLFPRER